MWIRTECLGMFCWLLHVSVGSVEVESPMSDERTRTNCIMESLLDKAVSCMSVGSTPSKNESYPLTTGEVLCSAFLQVYEAFLPAVKETETRLFGDLVLSGLCMLLAASQSAKVLAQKSEFTCIKFLEYRWINYCSFTPPDGLLESTLEIIKTIHSKLSLSAVEFPTASKKVSAVDFVVTYILL